MSITELLKNTLGTDLKYVQQMKSKRGTLGGNKIVDHSDVVGALPVGAAPTTSSFLTQHLTSMEWAKTSARRDEKHLSFGIWCALYQRFDSNTRFSCVHIFHRADIRMTTQIAIFIGTHMGPTWVLSAPGGPHVGPMNLAIKEPSLAHKNWYILTPCIVYPIINWGHEYGMTNDCTEHKLDANTVKPLI